MSVTTATRSTYALPATDRERQRLMSQAEMVRPITRRLFVDAGIGPGMRVLDLGCGVGDVSLLLADLVGPTGEVVGVDRDRTQPGGRQKPHRRMPPTSPSSRQDLADLAFEGDLRRVRRSLYPHAPARTDRRHPDGGAERPTRVGSSPSRTRICPAWSRRSCRRRRLSAAARRHLTVLPGLAGVERHMATATVRSSWRRGCPNRNSDGHIARRRAGLRRIPRLRRDLPQPPAGAWSASGSRPRPSSRSIRSPSGFGTKSWRTTQ